MTDDATGEGDRVASRDIRIDLHLHTLASRDCLSDPEEVLARALEAGLDRIAITDHDRIGAALEMARRHPARIIPGEEVKTAEGVDVIGLYLEEEIPKGTPARETCRRIREQGGIVYLPHPFAPGKGGSGELAESLASDLDVVEVFNSRLHRAALNQRAEEFARRHGLPRGAGSDAHSLGEVGRAFVEIPDHPNEPGDLLEALGAARIRGRESPRRVHLLSTWAKVRKRLPGARSLESWKRESGDPAGSSSARSSSAASSSSGPSSDGAAKDGPVDPSPVHPPTDDLGRAREERKSP